MNNQQLIDIATKLKYGKGKGQSNAGNALLSLDEEGIRDLVESVNKIIPDYEDDPRTMIALQYVLEFVSAKESSDIIQNGLANIIEKLKNMIK